MIVWWLGDAVGVLVVAPLVLQLFHVARNRTFDISRVPEGTLLVVSSTVLNLIIFLGGSWTGLRIEFPLEYAIFPLFTWAALRF